MTPGPTNLVGTRTETHSSMNRTLTNIHVCYNTSPNLTVSTHITPLLLVPVHVVVVVVRRRTSTHRVADLGPRLTMCVFCDMRKISVLVRQRARHGVERDHRVVPAPVPFKIRRHREVGPAVVLQDVQPVRVREQY